MLKLGDWILLMPNEGLIRREVVANTVCTAPTAIDQIVGVPAGGGLRPPGSASGSTTDMQTCRRELRSATTDPLHVG